MGLSSLVPSPSPREALREQQPLQIHHRPHGLRSSSGEKSSKIGGDLLAKLCGFSREGASLSMPLLLPSEIPANLILAKIMERKGDAEIKKEGDDT